MKRHVARMRVFTAVRGADGKLRKVELPVNGMVGGVEVDQPFAELLPSDDKVVYSSGYWGYPSRAASRKASQAKRRPAA